MVPVGLLGYFAQTIAVSITSASRPAMTFLLIQLSVHVSYLNGWISVSPEFQWMISPVTLGVSLVLMILEFLSQHEPDISTILDDFHVTPLFNAFGTLSSALLLHALGMPTEEAMMLLDGSQTNQVTSVTADVIANGGKDTATQVGLVVGSITANLGLTYYRARLHEWLDELDLLLFWQRLEAGGVLAALCVLIFSPVLCLILLVMAVISGAIFGVIIRKIQNELDHRSRYECPHCGEKIRSEAILCFSCHNDVEPKILLERQSPQRKFMDLFTNQQPKKQST